MTNIKKLFFIGYLTIVSFSLSIAQTNTYILNGAAQQNTCNCYTLTPAIQFQSGSVWNKNKIDLNTGFDFWFNVFLGCADDDGADGIAFILQPISTSVGNTGSGLGFAGVAPSIGITLDTYQNINPMEQPTNDPPYDHIAIQTNGNLVHGSDLAGPVPVSSTSDNVEDCKWHVLRISWDPGTKWLRSYFDGVLRVQVQVDMLKTIFNNDPNVYWGFTGATGGKVNLQQFCTALNPVFKTDLPNNAACENATVHFDNHSESFAPIVGYLWDFGDSTSTSQEMTPTHYYNQPGIYQVKLEVTGKDGCKNDSTKIITIGTKPVSNFTAYDTCLNAPLRIIDASTNSIGNISQWNWILNGSSTASGLQPHFDSVHAGTNQLQLSVTSEYGCTSASVIKTVILKDIPEVAYDIADGCANAVIPFKATQTDTKTNISKWHWGFGDTTTASTAIASHLYIIPATYNIQSWALADNGCSSDTLRKTLFINQSYAFAGNDTIIIKNLPYQLNGTGATGTIQWLPATDLTNANTFNPTAILQDDQTFELTVTTTEGCVAKDTVAIQVFKGSAIYVPNAFTPDNNGMNDLLKPKYIGIKKLEYFTIYNRWGQRVYTTNSMDTGWDGAQSGKPLTTGTYVWMLKATDIAGKVYQLKGTATLIR